MGDTLIGSGDPRVAGISSIRLKVGNRNDGHLRIMDAASLPQHL